MATAVAIVCSLSFVIVSVMAWFAPEMDEAGRIIGASSAPGHDPAQIERPRADIIRMRPPLEVSAH